VHHAFVANAMAGTIVAVVAFAKLNTRNFGKGVGLFGGLKCASEQGRFFHALRCHAGVNTSRTDDNNLRSPEVNAALITLVRFTKFLYMKPDEKEFFA
jgi:hypothetical protein